MSRSSEGLSFEELEKSINYQFSNTDLLREALTHKSFYHESRDKTTQHNERLEFLGDSVIGVIVVEYLFLHEQRYSEAELAKMKSYLVCEAVFSRIADILSLSRYILLGRGEESTGGRTKKSIRADALEALVGAVYLDAGFEKTRELVLRFMRDTIDSVIASGEFFDYKTELQEKTQLLYGKLPEYKLLKEDGEEHKRVFTVAVYLGDEYLGMASGSRKKEAEALAARKALKKLRDQPGP